jgi:hypothetical protein
MQRTVSKQDGSEALSETPVEVVGLQSQLTVPSRTYPKLVDLWIEVSWPQRTERWDEEFRAATASALASSNAVGSLSLQTLSQYRGWIVARGVPRDREAHRALEACVRSIVDQANLRCVASTRAPEQRAHRARWSVRTLSMLGGVAAIFSTQAQ